MLQIMESGASVERSGTALYDGWIQEAVKAAMSGKAEGTQASVFLGIFRIEGSGQIGVLCAEDT